MEISIGERHSWLNHDVMHVKNRWVGCDVVIATSSNIRNQTVSGFFLFQTKAGAWHLVLI